MKNTTDYKAMLRIQSPLLLTYFHLSGPSRWIRIPKAGLDHHQYDVFPNPRQLIEG